MNDIANVKVHLRTRRGNVNIIICMSEIFFCLQQGKSDEHTQLNTPYNVPHYIRMFVFTEVHL